MVFYVVVAVSYAYEAKLLHVGVDLDAAFDVHRQVMEEVKYFSACLYKYENGIASQIVSAERRALPVSMQFIGRPTKIF